MNIWSFTGNLGKDSEVRYLPSGEPICTFSVAVKSGYGDKQKTTWASCALFGKAAAGSLPQYLTTGTQVAISGEISLDEWTAQDGTKKTTLKVNVVKVDLIGSSNQKEKPVELTNTHNEPQKPAPAGFDSFDDDIPF